MQKEKYNDFFFVYLEKLTPPEQVATLTRLFFLLLRWKADQGVYTFL